MGNTRAQMLNQTQTGNSKTMGLLARIDQQVVELAAKLEPVLSTHHLTEVEQTEKSTQLNQRLVLISLTLGALLENIEL